MLSPQLEKSPISDMNFSRIEEYAGQIRRGELPEARGGYERRKENLRDFVARLGGRIETLEIANIDLLGSGSLKVIRPADFVIYLSPFTGVMRDNFTIAHELGHYFLHYLPHVESFNGQVFQISRIGEGPLEQQANRFAAALLMPLEEFTALAQSLEGDSSTLAGHFQVSQQAAEVRLASLKLKSR